MAVKKKQITYVDAFRLVRGSWNGVNPVTKVIPNKKKNPKIKHKGRVNDE